MPQAAFKKIRQIRAREEEGLDRAQRSQMIWTAIVGLAMVMAAIFRLSAPKTGILEPVPDPSRSAADLLAPVSSNSILDRSPAAAAQLR